MPTWKPIPFYLRYEISDEGEVRSPVGAPFSVHEQPSGAIVALKSDRGTRKHVTRGYLVLSAFVNPQYRFRVYHLDRTTLNDRLDNLRPIPFGVSGVSSELHPIEGERWAPISEADGLYEASSEGRIRRAETKTLLRPTVVGERKTYQQIVIRPGGGKTRSLYVHRAVLSAFNGAPPDGCTADHLNRNTLDNRLVNLRWLPSSDNVCQTNTHTATPYSVSAARIGAVLGIVAATGVRFRAHKLTGTPDTTVAAICEGKTELSRVIARELGFTLPLGGRTEDS